MKRKGKGNKARQYNKRELMTDQVTDVGVAGRCSGKLGVGSCRVVPAKVPSRPPLQTTVHSHYPLPLSTATATATSTSTATSTFSLHFNSSLRHLPPSQLLPPEHVSAFACALCTLFKPCSDGALAWVSGGPCPCPCPRAGTGECTCTPPLLLAEAMQVLIPSWCICRLLIILLSSYYSC